MKRQESISRLHRLLTRKHQPPMSLQRICEELECSPSTAKRCIRDLRDRFAHPIDYDEELNGYHYSAGHDGFDGWELPGLWFNESELTALLTMRALLEQVHPGLFEGDLAPLGRRIEAILEQTGVEPAEVARRIRVVSIAGRNVLDRIFRAAADSVLTRRRLVVQYRSRGRDGDWEQRELSPQRLVRYRDNWYLDAWCHTREDVRVFALDAMSDPKITDKAAKEVPAAELDAVMRSSYGIFAGESDQRALLRFTPRRAQWVSKEDWHSEQHGRFLPDGSWELSVPYAVPHELIMDVLKYGGDVEVIEPPELRVAVVDHLREAAARYGMDTLADSQRSA